MKTLSRAMVFCSLAIIIPLQGMRENNEGDEQRKRKNIESATVLVQEQKKLKKMKKVDVQKMMNEAFECLQKNQHDRGIALYEKLLAEKIPSQQKVNCWMNLGMAYWQVKKNDLAITMFENVLQSNTKKKNPDIVRVKYCLARLLLEQNKDIEKALKLLKKCAKQNLNKTIAIEAMQSLCSFYKRTNKNEEGLPWANMLMNNDVAFPLQTLNIEVRFVGHFYWVLFKDFKNQEDYLKELNEVVKIFNILPKEAQARQLDRYNYIVDKILQLKGEKAKSEDDLESSESDLTE